MTPEETVDLGGVQVKTSDPTYKRLVSKWYTNEQLVSAYQNIQKTRPQSKLPSNNTTQAPVEQPPQQQPQPSVVVNTAPVDTTATDIKSKPIRDIPKQNKPELLPQSDYLDDSEARQTNIVANLNNARLTNPQSLKTVDDFRKYYNYAGRSELQRQTLDNWYKWFTTGKDLAMKSTSDILNMYKSGTITNTELDNINVADPEKYNEIRWIIEKDQKMNKYANELYTGEDKKTTNPLQWIINNYVNNLKNFANDPSIYTEYKDAMNSDNIKAQNRAIIEWQADLDSIDLEIANKENEIKKRYEWSWATSSKINAIVADETKDLYNMKSNKSIALNTAINKYNSEVASIKDTLEMKKQEQELQTQQRQQQMSELWFAMNLMSYETPDQQEERAWNNFIRQQEYVDGNIYSNDPATRKKAVTKAVESVLTEFAWIPITRSKEQIVSDIQALVDSGKDLWQAITENVRKPIMEKPEYKRRLNDKFGIDTSKSLVEIWWQTYLMDKDGNFTSPNLPWTLTGTTWDLRGMASQFPWQARAKNNNPAGITWNANFDNPKPWSTAQRLIDAWIKFSKWTARPSGEWGNYVTFNTIEDWLAAQRIMMQWTYWNSTVGTMLQKRVWTANWPAYAKSVAGNAGINLNTKVSDLSQAELEKLQLAKIQRESPWLYKLLQSWGAKKDEALTDKQFTQSNQIITSFKWDPQVKAFEEAYSQWLSLLSSLNDASWPWDVAAIFQFMKTLDPQSVVRESEFETAAKSAWVTQYIGNTFDRISEWKKLTSEQSKAFAKLAKQFIVNKSKIYDTKYKDWIRRLEQQWITTNVFPTSMADDMRKYLWVWSEQSKNNNVTIDLTTLYNPIGNIWFTPKKSPVTYNLSNY